MGLESCADFNQSGCIFGHRFPKNPLESLFITGCATSAAESRRALSKSRRPMQVLTLEHHHKSWFSSCFQSQTGCLDRPDYGLAPPTRTGPLHQACRATVSHYILSHYVFQDLEGCRRRIALHPLKGRCSTNISALKGGVTLQFASWKVSRYKGVLQLHNVVYTVACPDTVALGRLAAYAKCGTNSAAS